MSFTSLDRLLDKSVNRAGIRGHLIVQQLFAAFEEVVAEHLGEAAARVVKPLYFKQGTLTVACLSTAVADQLVHQQARLIDDVNRLVGKQLVQTVRCIT